MILMIFVHYVYVIWHVLCTAVHSFTRAHPYLLHAYFFDIHTSKNVPLSIQQWASIKTPIRMEHTYIVNCVSFSPHITSHIHIKSQLSFSPDLSLVVCLVLLLLLRCSIQWCVCVLCTKRYIKFCGLCFFFHLVHSVHFDTQHNSIQSSVCKYWSLLEFLFLILMREFSVMLEIGLKCGKITFGFYFFFLSPPSSTLYGTCTIFESLCQFFFSFSSTMCHNFSLPKAIDFKMCFIFIFFYLFISWNFRWRLLCSIWSAW